MPQTQNLQSTQRQRWHLLDLFDFHDAWPYLPQTKCSENICGTSGRISLSSPKARQTDLCYACMEGQGQNPWEKWGHRPAVFKFGCSSWFRSFIKTIIINNFSRKSSVFKKWDWSGMAGVDWESGTLNPNFSASFCLPLEVLLGIFRIFEPRLNATPLEKSNHTNNKSPALSPETSRSFWTPSFFRLKAAVVSTLLWGVWGCGAFSSTTEKCMRFLF